MISTVLALLATTAAIDAPAARTGYSGGSDPITATTVIGTDRYCIRSGWTSASIQTNRLVRRGECHSDFVWRTRGLKFDVPAVEFAKARRARQAERIAAR